MKTIFPEEQNIERPDRSILTIYTGPERFSFSLYDPEKTNSFLYKELIGENRSDDALSVFKEAFFKHTFFSLPYRKVWIMNRTPSFTFVPRSFYKDECREDFVRFLFSDRQGITLSSSVSSEEITVLYQLPEEIYRFMVRSFAKPEFVHYSTPVIKYFLKKSKKVDTCQMIVNLREKGVDIFCFLKETFILGNYFPCKGMSEALYYILFTWKQLQMNQLNDCLHITGDAVFKETLTEKLKLYLRNVYHLPLFSERHFGGVEAERIPLELAALSVCGS